MYRYKILKINPNIYKKYHMLYLLSSIVGVVVGIEASLALFNGIPSSILIKWGGLNSYDLLMAYFINVMSFLFMFLVFDLFRLLPCRALHIPCRDAVYVVNGISNVGQAVVSMVLRIPRIIFISEDIASDSTDYKAVLAHEEHHIRWWFITTLVIAVTGAAFVTPFYYLAALLTLYHHVNVIENYILTPIVYCGFITFFSTLIIMLMLNEALADLAAYYSVGRAPPALLRRKSLMSMSSFSKGGFKELMRYVRARYGKFAMALIILAYPFTYLGLSLISYVHPPDFRSLFLPIIHSPYYRRGR